MSFFHDSYCSGYTQSPAVGNDRDDDKCHLDKSILCRDRNTDFEHLPHRYPF